MQDDQTVRRGEIINTIVTNINVHQERGWALLDQAFKQKDAADQVVVKAIANPTNEGLVEIATLQLASADKALKSAGEAREAVGIVAQAAAEICKNYSINLALVKKYTEQINQQTSLSETILEQALKQKDAADQVIAKAVADPTNKALMEIAKLQLSSADKAIEAACQAGKAAKKIAQASAEICKHNGINPELLSKYTEEIAQQVTLLLETIKDIGKQESIVLSETLQVDKELFIEFLQTRQVSVAETKPCTYSCCAWIC